MHPATLADLGGRSSSVLKKHFLLPVGNCLLVLEGPAVCRIPCFSPVLGDQVSTKEALCLVDGPDLWWWSPPLPFPVRQSWQSSAFRSFVARLLFRDTPAPSWTLMVRPNLMPSSWTTFLTVVASSAPGIYGSTNTSVIS